MDLKYLINSYGLPQIRKMSLFTMYLKIIEVGTSIIQIELYLFLDIISSY